MVLAGALDALAEFVIKRAYPLSLLPMVLFTLFFAACSDTNGNKQGALLPIPQREENTFITDQMKIAGKALYIWSLNGKCQVRIGAGNDDKPGQAFSLKPTAPCYFMKSPGTQEAQVFQQDKVTRVIAVLGTPGSDHQSKRCGSEVQGLLINSRGKVTVSERVATDAEYCESNGLDNFQYSLFSRS